VTTNFMGFNMGLNAPVDYWRWSGHMDVVSNDHYLIAADERNFQDLAMTADLTRGWALGKPWLLMEHSTSAVNWQPRNVAKAPGEMLRNSLQHVARGTDGVLFFQWRASRAGAEKYHSGLVPHAGRDSKVWREVVELGRALESISEVAGSTVQADACIIHDTDARWGTELDSHPSEDARNLPETRRWHDALYRAGVTTDIRQSTDDLSGYKLVIAPMLYLVTDEAAAKLHEYVEAGGTLVITYFSGIVDENDHIRMDPVNGGGYPGAFSELLGVSMEEFFPLRSGDAVGLSRFGAGTVWSELGKATGAEVLATFDGGAATVGSGVDGSPAVTRRAGSTGRGAAYYVATSLGREGLAELVQLLCSDAGVEPVLGVRPPEDVEIVRRSNGTKDWTFVINHSAQDAQVPLDGVELLSGTPTGGTLNLTAGGVAVVATPA
jgi:beta-galactosidase